MEEYRIDLKIRNNIILKKIEEAGYKTIGEFCRLNNCMKFVPRISDIVNMKLSPINKDGNFNSSIIKVSEIIGCAPDDLFTDTQLHTELKTNKRSIQVNEAEMRFMLDKPDQKLLEDRCLEEQRDNAIDKLLETITLRERRIIEMRMGLGEYDREHTLKEIGEYYGVTGEVIRQIEVRALRKMRHPSRSEGLRVFIGLE